MRIAVFFCAALALSGIVAAQQEQELGELDLASPIEVAAQERIIAAALTAAAVPSKPVLPQERPPLWPFRSYKDTSSWSCEINRNGALFLKVCLG